MNKCVQYLIPTLSMKDTLESGTSIEKSINTMFISIRTYFILAIGY